MTNTTVAVNGIELHYRIVGDGDGEPLLLLHGFTGCADDWVHAGQDVLGRGRRLILVDARGHGGSTNPAGTITHRQCARDLLALLDHLDLRRCQAVGLSMGGNILLHAATMDPARLEAMVVVSATMYYPEQARRLMRLTPPDEAQPPDAWALMRQRHRHGDDQIRALWRQQRAFADDFDDLAFTPPSLARITARTLIVYGDRDPLYPVEMALDLYRAIPGAALWVVPGGGHAPVFTAAAGGFARAVVDFLGAAVP